MRGVAQGSKAWRSVFQGMPAEVAGMTVGIFGCDPGGSTGIAWGVFDEGAPIAQSLRDRAHAGSTTVTGDAPTQIREIADIWAAFYQACTQHAGLDHDEIWFVCEDFVYRSKQVYGGDDSSISISIIWGIEGYRMGKWDSQKHDQLDRYPSMILQTAGEAKSFATKERLKDFGIWVVGRDHERSAWAHIALLLKKLQLRIS